MPYAISPQRGAINNATPKNIFFDRAAAWYIRLPCRIKLFNFIVGASFSLLPCPTYLTSPQIKGVHAYEYV